MALLQPVVRVKNVEVNFRPLRKLKCVDVNHVTSSFSTAVLTNSLNCG